MRIYEIYRSIQGESTYAGQPCTFVRTGGCSLRCVYCDTPYAIPNDSGEEMPLDEVIRRVTELEVGLVELTGGEPMEQAETPELCRRLLDSGMTVLIETGGHVSIEPLPREVVKILDIKTPGSKMTRKMKWENLDTLAPHDEIKFVICDRLDFEWAEATCREHNLFNKHVIHFSPSFHHVDPKDLAQWILEEKIPVRLQLQIHKYIWSPDAKGV